MDLPDPFSIPGVSASVNTIAGLVYASLSLLAIIPTTLSCTAGIYTTSTLSARVAACPNSPFTVAVSSISVICRAPASVMLFLSLLTASSSLALASATFGSLSSKNSRLCFASPSLPAALMHGPIRNPRSYVDIFFSFLPLSLMRAFRPGLRLSFRLSRAYFT